MDLWDDVDDSHDVDENGGNDGKRLVILVVVAHCCRACVWCFEYHMRALDVGNGSTVSTPLHRCIYSSGRAIAIAIDEE